MALTLPFAVVGLVANALWPSVFRLGLGSAGAILGVVCLTIDVVYQAHLGRAIVPLFRQRLRCAALRCIRPTRARTRDREEPRHAQRVVRALAQPRGSAFFPVASAKKPATKKPAGGGATPDEGSNDG